MKLKILMAIILTAALLLCSCGNAETDENGGGITVGSTTAETTAVTLAETKIAETLTEATTDAETLVETEETSKETTATLPEDPTQTANKNAELIFEKIAIHSAKINSAREDPVNAYFDLSSMNDEIIEAAVIYNKPVEIKTEFIEDIGGSYITINSDEGVPLIVIWASSLESNLIGVYPKDDSLGVNNVFKEAGGDYSLGEAVRNILLGYIADSMTKSANTKAKQVYQNAATWLLTIQIDGSKYDSLEYSGSLNTKTEAFMGGYGDTLPLSEAVVTFYLSYYMGGEDGGYYTILLDEHYNIIGALWAADEETSVVGAFPVARTIDENQSGNITTADIYEAAGVNR
jgi:hypothetical protein